LLHGCDLQKLPATDWAGVSLQRDDQLASLLLELDKRQTMIGDKAHRKTSWKSWILARSCFATALAFLRILSIPHRAFRASARSGFGGNLNFSFRLSIKFYRLSWRQLSGVTNRLMRGSEEPRNFSASTKFHSFGTGLRARPTLG
jgi:hypothetical protein